MELAAGAPGSGTLPFIRWLWQQTALLQKSLFGFTNT
jgi:hypothetical protein